MIPMAYKRIWITYPVHFINGHHQLTPVSCILYTRLNRSVQLQKHLAVSTRFSVLMPRFLRRSSAQALLPVQILPTLYTNFSMKTVLHQPPRVAFPSSAPESLAGVFPCVHSHLHMHSISRTHRILGPSHLVSLPQSSILALHHRPWHGDPVLHGPHPQCYAWSSISSSVSQNLETILPLLWRPHPLPLQHVFHLSSYLPQAMKLPQEKKQKLSRIWLGWL